MSEPSATEADREERLAGLLADMTAQARTGSVPDVDAVARANPSLAGELAELWAVAQLADVFARRAKSSPPAPRSTARHTNGTATAALPARPLPADFGDYVLLRELGRGGMGVVYLARQKSLGRQVALKVLLRGAQAGDEEKARFRVEAEAAARLRHPNIVTILETGEHDGLLYYSMPYVEGEPLSRLTARGPVPPREAARLVADVARAVQHAHEHGIVHRDLKPSNILLSRADEAADVVPFVLDFGLAKRLATDQDGDPLTATGAILGTPAYMAPEQAAGSRGRTGPPADIYSLGAMLYELLTGRPPFQAATPLDTLLLVLEQDPVPPRALNAKVDRDLELICLRCLQKPADLRYGSAAEMANDLEAFLAGTTIAAQPGGLGHFLSRLLRETHHATVLENWGLVWMWHSLAVFLLCALTQVMAWNGHTGHMTYLLLWGVGLVTWGAIGWQLRRRGGPILAVERQIAHAWAGGILGSVGLFVAELLMSDRVAPLTFSPAIAVIAGMVFLFKAGTLSGTLYIPAAVNFLTAAFMARYPDWGVLVFGAVSAVCFFVPGLKYHRQRQRRK